MQDGVSGAAPHSKPGHGGRRSRHIAVEVPRPTPGLNGKVKGEEGRR